MAILTPPDSPGPLQSVAPFGASREDVFAAVDLGSNSFHLIVAQPQNGQMLVVDRLRETVRLAGGLGEDKRLSEDVQLRALDCLQRFGQRLRNFSPGAVRVVGTNALRIARNGEAFRRRAEYTLGHRVEVIAGREEARLIYLGVAHSLGGDRHRRLVVDIGGGSTEFIVGEGFDPLFRESLYMGCVGLSAKFFPGGRIDRASMRSAELAARVELEPIKSRISAGWWEEAVGSSGTVKSIAKILREAGWSDGDITRDGLRRLRELLIAAGSIDAVKFQSLRAERRPVLVGGLACLWAVFDELGVETLGVSDMALREGLLYDLHGRIHHEDVRERTLRGLVETYKIDAGQANRVGRTALALLSDVASHWDLEDAEAQSMLRWAAQLHEIGLAVSHNQYHKHGAYLLANGDMAGFSNQEQAVLASLVRGHRRKFPKQVFEDLPDPQRASRLCRLLRIAVVIHRGRTDSGAPPIEVHPTGNALEVQFPPNWLEEYPLTRADLQVEASVQGATGHKLTYR